ncbi:MAG: efflux RND transporter periplasmic adaptor subunit [Ignavibacteria bacterium]|jgi:RND family efflux transporter MFP subunit|nr:efflux RND transporter periplasmic adaptor subunit [Ignavibacteria bacterium]MCU7505197.1 efflux RND transporter periplasmic adaptor subunit [Ignavibacteria bacterium]MCU7518100.1 efflux RND transporter periplasmic adaptor subunit [Ignavibacteria bacterium]
MNKRTKLIIIIAAALVIIFIGFRIFSGRQDNQAPQATRQMAPLVQVEKPLRQDVTYMLRYTGDISPVQQANIFSKVSGNIERMYADIGSRVRRNQMLAVIDSTELFQQYEQALATFNNNKINYNRTKQLFQQNLIARQELDNAEAALKVSSANFATAQTRLSYARITAPFSGYITKRFLDRGALVQPGSSTLYTIMDNDSVKIVVNILEKDIPSIALGKKAILKVDAFPGRDFLGTISRVNQAIDLTTRTLAVEIVIPNRDYALKPGMYAEVNIIAAQHLNTLTVPVQSVMHDDKGNFVYLFEGGNAKRGDVQTGADQNGRTEVTRGLTDSANVITVGQQFLKDGIKVRLAKNK